MDDQTRSAWLPDSFELVTDPETGFEGTTRMKRDVGLSKMDRKEYVVSCVLPTSGSPLSTKISIVVVEVAAAAAPPVEIGD